MPVTSFATTLISALPQYADTDSDWMSFVKDYRTLLIATATKITIDPNIMRTHRYSLRELLRRHTVPIGMDWIIIWLNQLHGSKDVINLKTLIVPSTSEVTTLYENYTAHKLKKRNASS